MRPSISASVPHAHRPWRALLSYLLVVALIVPAVPQAAPQAPSPAGLKIVVIDGEEAANIVDEKIAAEPVIEVRDRDDRKVVGAVVRFQIRRGVRNRLSAAFGRGQEEFRTLTDSAGRARAPGLTPLEPGRFEIEIQVSHQGQSATTTIRHTNFSTTAQARSAGREPGQSSAGAAAVAGAAGASGAGGVTAAGGAAGAGGASTAGGAAAAGAAAGGGGLSTLAIVGLAVGGAAGVGAAVALAGGGGSDSPSSVTPPPPPGRVTGVTASVSSGLVAATPFAFSAQVADFTPGALTYRWDFGDGTTSSEASPTKVYSGAGTYTVAVTISDTRQSARSEMTVAVYSLTGRWVNPASGTSYMFTQTGTTLTGVTSGTVTTGTPPWSYTNCPLSGSVRSAAPTVVFNRPECRNGAAANQFLFAGDFRLDLAANGQSLTGETTQPAPFGTQTLTLQRQ